MNSLEGFQFPIRDADIWGLTDEYSEKRDPDDIASDLDSNQRAVENYLSHTLPAVYIQQAELASGTIDPAQLATGTPGAGKAPVGNPPVWVDVATQAELDAVAATIPTDLQIKRGTVAWTLGITDTNTSTTVIFSSVYSVAPVVTLALAQSTGLNLAAELTSVTSAQFVTRVFPTAGLAVGVASGVAVGVFVGVLVGSAVGVGVGVAPR